MFRLYFLVSAHPEVQIFTLSVKSEPIARCVWFLILMHHFPEHSSIAEVLDVSEGRSFSVRYLVGVDSALVLFEPRDETEIAVVPVSQPKTWEAFMAEFRSRVTPLSRGQVLADEEVVDVLGSNQLKVDTALGEIFFSSEPCGLVSLYRSIRISLGWISAGVIPGEFEHFELILCVSPFEVRLLIEPLTF